MNATKSLYLDHVRIDQGLVRSLPVEVARRYQALPISTDGSQITIAMAHPEDPDACQAVTSAMGVPACMVQVDSCEIEHLLAEIWPQNQAPLPRVLFWVPATEISEQHRAFSQAFAAALKADLKLLHVPWRGDQSVRRVIIEAGQQRPDLIFFPIPDAPKIPQLLVDFAINKLIEETTASILVFREPCWPFHKLLLVIRDGNEMCESTVDWLIRLAKPDKANVTILPLLPPVPEMYGPFIQHNLSALLTTNDPFGQKMRWIARRLSSENITGTFRLRNETPLEQLHSELTENDVDLVIIAAESHNHLWRWLFGEVVNDLSVWFDRPLLITKPIRSQS